MPTTKKLLRKSLTFIFFFCLIAYSYAQNKTSGEIGLTMGGTYYLGEYNKMPFKGTNLAAGAFYRHTFDTRFAITGNFYYGKLSGKESNSDYIVGDKAPSEFSNTFYEISPVAEFNFIPFLPGKPKKHFSTPYVFAGFGAAYYPNGATKVILSIPFGIGMKYNLTHKFVFGLYAGMRKTFTDKIDYDYFPPSPSNPEKQWGYQGNKDWYSIFGVSLSYKIKYRVKCPAFN